MPRISVEISVMDRKYLAQLVEEEHFLNQSDAVRTAIRDLIKEKLGVDIKDD